MLNRAPIIFFFLETFAIHQDKWRILLLMLALQQYASQTTITKVSSVDSKAPIITVRLDIKDGHVTCYDNKPCNNNGDCFVSLKSISIFHCR